MEISLLDFNWKKIASILIDEINLKARTIDTDYKEISDILNVDPGYIHKILKKKKDLTFRAFIRLCLALIEINKNKDYPLQEEELLPSSILKKLGL